MMYTLIILWILTSICTYFLYREHTKKTDKWTNIDRLLAFLIAFYSPITLWIVIYISCDTPKRLANWLLKPAKW